jgi:ABC-type phosphate transport system substrate-binding protein
LNNAGKSFVTIPFQLGAISFFHNVPGVPDGKALDLQPCVLAKIFTRKIKTWDHADILSSNPGFSPPAGKEITVVRRIYGSSSTSLISQYLYKVCPSDWDIGVGKGNALSSNPTVPTDAPFWPSDTVAAEGSGGVSDAISATEYSIGYIESGHGQALGLAEVALQNKDGNYLTAADADIGSAVMQIMSSIPNADGDWDNDNLSLLDLGGEKTWPITAFSFMFIRKDLTSLGRSGPAVKAFAEMVLSTEGQAMLPDFGANAVPASIIAKGVAGLAQLKFAATSTMFIHELSTLAGTGMGTHVLSVKRKRWADVEREQLVADFEKLKADYEATIAALKSEDANTITKDELERLAVPALVFAVIAFLMICTSLILGGVSCTRTRRHERFFNEDDTLREKYATSSKA